MHDVGASMHDDRPRCHPGGMARIKMMAAEGGVVWHQVATACP
ncbi:hypothetical protein SXCC_03261 [Gluconacetobacter sp. SXCC-1]|nr:hypothetical protein SXCC_03261 [Gluconacetobacter sp. SXCC-1]